MYEWVKNITGYFLFLAVIEHLIPGKKYEKYFRLFAGMVAILLVIQPFGKNLGLDERIAHFYENLVLQYQAEDLQEQFLGAEQERLEQMISVRWPGNWESQLPAARWKLSGSREQNNSAKWSGFGW